jgi:methylated-DNA-[protein]-cysteine S-methyltransferase
MNVYTVIESPLGPLTLRSDGQSLTGVHLPKVSFEPAAVNALNDPEAAPFPEARRQFDEYFRGARTRFDLPMAPQGTVFQQQVWRALLSIPYGRTLSYGEIAKAIGSPNAFRAVGLANGRNPLAIIVPCHRVIGANGKLVGFAGGLECKQTLLSLEAEHAGAGARSLF